MTMGKSDRGKLKTYYVSVKGMKKGENIYLLARDADDVKIEQEADYVEGKLRKILFEEQEFEGKKFDKCKIYLVDGDQQYILEGRMTKIMRSILNSLLNCTSFHWIKVSVYMNKKGYPSVWVESNGKAPGFKYTLEQMKELTEEILNARGEIDHFDYFKLDQMLINDVIETIIPHLKPEKREGTTIGKDIKREGDKVEKDDEEDKPALPAVDPDAPLPF